MSLLRVFLWMFCSLSACSIARAGADSAAISGTVRDSDGHTLPNVTVSLSGGSTQQVSSSASGQFHFDRLGPGEYTLSAILTGYAASGPQPIHLQSNPVTIDIVLRRVSAAPLEFQSSGIHGLIDPGGYSASTASASSNVLRSIASLKRTDTSFVSSAKDWPCDLEPQLLQAVAQHPDQPEASLRLGQFYVAHDQPTLAIAPLQHALQLDATSDLAGRTLASAWLQAGSFDQACKALSHALATSKSPDLYELLARADEGSGQFREAAQNYRRAAALSTSEESSFGIGYELLLSGALVESSAAFAEGIRRYPKSIVMQIGAGTVHLLQGNNAAALSDFLAAAETDPADPRPYSFLNASATLSSDKQDRVLAAFRRYLDLEPRNADANYFYAVALARDKSAINTPLTETLLKRASLLNPALAKAHQQLAESYARRGDFAEAVPEYEAALHLAPDTELHYRLALAYKRLGRADDSAREMQFFLQSRESDRQSVSTGSIDLAQFISVIEASDSRSSPSLQCLATPR